LSAGGEGGLDYAQLISNDQCLISKQNPDSTQIIERQDSSAELTTSNSGILITRQIIEKQEKLFKIQLDLALKYDLPIIMHLRNKNGGGSGLDAYKDALKILDNLPKMPKGVVHFFKVI